MSRCAFNAQAATAQVIISRPDNAAAEIGRLLQDAKYVVQAGSAAQRSLAPAAWVEQCGLTAAIAAAVKKAVTERPADPLVAIGQMLEGTVSIDSPSRKAVVDALTKSLDRRASAEELTDKGILKASPGGVSGALQNSKLELEKQMKADALAKSLDRRASAEELTDKGILQPIAVE